MAIRPRSGYLGHYSARFCGRAALGHRLHCGKIINGVQHYFTPQRVCYPIFGGWWALEAGLNVLTGLLTRGVDYSDSLLADRYTHFVSVRVMEQAAALDLTTYEDPVFYDRLERARVQATDRLAMIQQMGRLFQQTLTTLIWTSDPALVLAVAGAAACAWRAAHVHRRNPFCFPGIREKLPPDSGQTADGLSAPGGRQPRRRQRAQALQPQRLSHQPFTQLSQEIYEENVALSRKKLLAGGLLGVIATLGYYGAYAFVIWRAVTGSYNNIGEFYYLTNAIIQASSNLQQVFSTASGIADQALFLTDLLAFFEMKPTVIRSRTGR